MDMNNIDIPTGEIIAPFIDTSVFDLASEARKAALIPYLGADNPKGQKELSKELSTFRWKAKGEGSSIEFSYEHGDIPFIEEIEDGTTAIVGGDNGMVTQPDQTKIPTLVRKEFWGREAKELSIDAINVKDDIEKTVSLLTKDSAKAAIPFASQEIRNQIKSSVVDYLRGCLA